MNLVCMIIPEMHQMATNLHDSKHPLIHGKPKTLPANLHILYYQIKPAKYNRVESELSKYFKLI